MPPSPWVPSGGGGVASVTASPPLASSGGANPNISMIAGASAVLFGTYAARPAPGIKGRYYITSDGPIVFVDDGVVWRPVVDGKTGAQIPLVASFANQYGSAVFTDSKGTIIATGNTGSISSLCNPYAANDVLVGHTLISQSTDATNCGIGFRNSSDNSQIALVQGNGGLLADWWVDEGSHGTGLFGSPLSDSRWLKIQDTGTALKYWSSSNGVDWLELTSGGFPDGGRYLVSGGTGPDQFGVFIETSGGAMAFFDSYQKNP